jgi:hypothetical protein
MVKSRLPDEAALFAASLPVVIEEAQALAGFEGVNEADLSTTRKSLVADYAAKALLLPARSHYKKEMSKVEGDQAGKVEFADKLKFLDTMETTLSKSIIERRAAIGTATDTGCAMVVVETE